MSKGQSAPPNIEDYTHGVKPIELFDEVGEPICYMKWLDVVEIINYFEQEIDPIIDLLCNHEYDEEEIPSVLKVIKLMLLKFNQRCGRRETLYQIEVGGQKALAHFARTRNKAARSKVVPMAAGGRGDAGQLGPNAH